MNGIRVVIVAAGLSFVGSACGEEAPYVHRFPAGGELHLTLRDNLDHPLYWWPRTLLNYRVQFSDAHIRAGALELTSNGKLVPFQLSQVKSRGGYLESALLSFFSDLPAGAERVFVLRRGRRQPSVQFGVRESRDGDTVTLDTGVMRVRLPASRAASAEVPGPLMQFSRGGAWLGRSRLVSPRRRVERITTTRVETGPLFICYRVTYSFEGGARYDAEIRAVAGYDFIYLRENMQGLAPAEEARVEVAWSNFHPTHRQAPNHPYERPKPAPGYKRYNWEAIDQPTVSTQHGVSSGLSASGELPFRLGMYQPWGAYVILTSANFWDERTGDAVGVFIDRVGGWNDQEYAIWSASNTLQVRYFYKDQVLAWRWPLVTGTRSTGIAVYDHKKDVQAMEDLDRLAHPFLYRDGLVYRARLSPISHTMFLQNRYGTIDLDLVKDWLLEYPDSAKRPPVIFREGTIRTADELEHRVFSSELTRDLPTQGTRQNAGFSPVPSRNIYGWFIDAYNRLYPAMSPRQRRRLTAMYLLLAYTHADEDYMPMKTMLSGHPNFLSDVKSAPPVFAFLFPQHPMAAEWADEFQKYLELNTRYHTRPPVKAWNAGGGRWTENLGTYVWAFLRPAIRANWALQVHVDGKNRFALPQMAWLGEWLVNALSAPFNGEDPKFYAGPDGRLPRHFWGMVTSANGPRRVHPPQGAHSARRMPPRTMWLLGSFLRNFAPLTAEHLMWAARPEDQDAELPIDEVDPWSLMYAGAANRGTNPHYKSSKYTGYGITLRAAVDSPGEVSVHLQQIDEGPNYRWGIAAEGGCGVIYYYARGRSYSHNGREDVGDRAAQDTDFCTNFGVWKNGMFRSVGRNVLDRPLYDLGVAQFAEITPRKGSNAYSWPEYQGRSILLVGSDYIVVYDDVFNDAIAHRFSWFTQVNDPMPFIHMLKGGARERERLVTNLSTGPTKGIWYDGFGDAMAVVTHEEGVQAHSTEFGARVKTASGEDLVFRNPDGIDFQTGADAFVGTAGIIRALTSGRSEMALFHGSRIRHGGVTLETDSTDLGISATFDNPSELAGVLSSPGASLKIYWAQPVEGLAFYLDGARQQVERGPGTMHLRLEPGRHRWQITAGPPTPVAPVIVRTENRTGGALVEIAPSAGATRYLVEMSRDGGATWTQIGWTLRNSLLVSGLSNGEKVHVRAIAVNGAQRSEPGPEYPIYVTDRPPEPPDGLRLSLLKDAVDLQWGEVLGASEYRIYRRAPGGGPRQIVYRGLARSFTDHTPGVIPAVREPGRAANSGLALPPHTIYEYDVTAVNGNGESRHSAAINTDPTSWVNWDPKPGERFRRRFTYNTTTYTNLGSEEDTDRHYPD